MQKKHRKKKFNFLAVFLFLLSTMAYSQDQKDLLKEVGIQFSDLDNFGLAFKKPLKNGKYLVMDGSLRIGYLSRQNNEDPEQSLTNFYSAFSINLEKRVLIGDKIYFVHGAGLGLDFGYDAIGRSDLIIDSQRNTVLRATLNPFYKIGFQYHFSETFYIEASIKPGFRLSYIQNVFRQEGEAERREQETIDVKASFNPQFARLGLFYRF